MSKVTLMLCSAVFLAVLGGLATRTPRVILAATLPSVALVRPLGAGALLLAVLLAAFGGPAILPLRRQLDGHRQARRQRPA